MTPKKQEPAKVPNPTRTFLYLGRRAGFGAKGTDVLAAYIEIEGTIDESKIPESQSFKGWKKPFGGWIRPGQFVTVEHPPGDPTSVYTNTVKVIGELHKPLCAELDALSLAAQGADRLRRERARDGKRKLSLEPLQPLRRAYMQAKGDEERAMLLARIIAYVTNNRDI
jgi:hypothetical protein